MGLHKRADIRAVIRKPWLTYVVVGTVVLAAFLLVPALRLGPLFNLIGLSGAIVIVTAMREHRPGHRLPWLLVAIGQVLFVAGDIITYNYARFFGTDPPFPSIGDLFYLSVYPFLVAGILLLVRHRSPGRDRTSLIDSLIVGIGVGTISWVFLISPYIADPTLTIVEKLVAMAYPLMDLILVTVAVRLAVGAGRRSTAFHLMMGSIAVLFVTDSIYGWMVLHGGYDNTTGYLEGGWGLFYLLWGAAALHPSTHVFDEPAVESEPKQPRRRLIILAAVHETVEAYPGLYRDVQTYLRERIKEVLTGSSESIVVRIYGPDLAVLRAKAAEIAERIGGVDGVVDAHASLQTDLPHIEVEPDVAAARAFGLTPGDIRRQASTMIASEEVSDIYSGGRAYDVHVTAIPSARDSVTDVQNLQLDTPTGARIRLQDVAEVRLAPTPNAIEREAQSRRIDVGANVEGRDLSSVVDAVEERLAGVSFPRAYHAEVLGESAELNAAQNRLIVFGLAAMLAIVLLLQAAFGSFRLALLTFLLLPMALVGGVLAVRLGDGVLSLGSLVGFLAVFGIAARNGILMISHFQRLEREEGQAFGADLVMRGATERLAPILMTASATGLALIPLAVAGSIPGHEIEHPMAIVILGGLFTATLLNLFVLPSLYLRFGRSHRQPGPRQSRVDGQHLMIAWSGRSGRLLWWRRAAAMLMAPARRRMVMARFRRLAMTRGPLRVRTWERSSS